jgi:hypothetical protein
MRWVGLEIPVPSVESARCRVRRSAAAPLDAPNAFR